ncbi:MAG: phosphotransferase family protein [Paracoccaceae bacterium]
MTPRVRRDGERIRKRVTDEAAARRLIAWAEDLRAGGVATPQARLDTRDGTLVFRLIEGTAGLALIVDRGAPALAGLLRPLLALHKLTLDGLPPFDPAAKILPRLRPDDPPAVREHLRVLPDRPCAASVHGDFHAGQVILDGAGTVWLLDLDDLATGAPESDLGNFAAHLATRPETRCGSVLQGLEHWLGHTLRAYRSIGGLAQTALAHDHGRVALVRRALKLREQDDPSILAELAGR